MDLSADCWEAVLRALFEFVPSTTSAVEDETVSADLLAVRLVSKTVLNAFRGCDGLSLWADALRVELAAKREQCNNLTIGYGLYLTNRFNPLNFRTPTDETAWRREIGVQIQTLQQRGRRIEALLRLHRANKESAARLSSLVQKLSL